MMSQISSEEPAKQFIEVLSHRMAYVEMGSGDPILFQHGNPTSSYMWRNVMPHLADQGRCIALDLIGMGDSDKLPHPGPDSYRFQDHRRFFDAALDALEVREKVTLVLHDWGCALGLDWACRHPDRVKGIAYMEGIVTPLSWSDWPEAIRPIFAALRSPAGEGLVLEKNIFVERILPGGVLRGLTEAEMAVYRRPYEEPGESRRPTLSWPREIPIDGDPADVTVIVADSADWMAENEIPKLFINAEPGVVLTGRPREVCRRWPNQREVTVRGAHFLPEDCPHEIGEAIAQWLRAIVMR
ncbi:MAG: haloalkane dehalogenase [Rhodothalassiaceae bacterium]